MQENIKERGRATPLLQVSNWDIPVQTKNGISGLLRAEKSGVAVGVLCAAHCACTPSRGCHGQGGRTGRAAVSCWGPADTPWERQHPGAACGTGAAQPPRSKPAPTSPPSGTGLLFDSSFIPQSQCCPAEQAHQHPLATGINSELARRGCLPTLPHRPTAATRPSTQLLQKHSLNTPPYTPSRCEHLNTPPFHTDPA